MNFASPMEYFQGSEIVAVRHGSNDNSNPRSDNTRSSHAPGPRMNMPVALHGASFAIVASFGAGAACLTSDLNYGHSSIGIVNRSFLLLGALRDNFTKHSSPNRREG
nr:hypothetical protein CFP56_68348 [Quercus suber]